KNKSVIMNIYARIRKIENPGLFKRFVNSILSSEHSEDFESIKEWHDFGIDGYLRSKKRVYAVYCPSYPERKTLQQYRDKITSDLNKLKTNLEQNKIKLKVAEWYFVTPDDLALDILNFIEEKTSCTNLNCGSLTAYSLAPLFMKHKNIHIDFPEITAGLSFDKVPNLFIKHVHNKQYKHIEIFNNGTEALEELIVEIMDEEGNWINQNNHFLFEFDNPVIGYKHSCFTLKMGERQYLVPGGSHKGNYHYKISAVGTESKKTLSLEGKISVKMDD
ncbi:hypothetical protein ACFL27_14290, partial [candidate division CSSED10-310 bacterium]